MSNERCGSDPEGREGRHGLSVRRIGHSEPALAECFGGVPEWPKGSDCKSDARASVVRIHPPPPLPQVVCRPGNAAWLNQGAAKPAHKSEVMPDRPSWGALGIKRKAEIRGFDLKLTSASPGNRVSQRISPAVFAIGEGGPGRKCASGSGGSRGYSSVVEPQPSKLMVRVRFPLPAPVACLRSVVRLMLSGSYSSVGRALPW